LFKIFYMSSKVLAFSRLQVSWETLIIATLIIATLIIATLIIATLNLPNRAIFFPSIHLSETHT
jgi:hypothetical protein